MKLSNIICAASALTCLVVASASAQVDKKVEVTQAFIPQVDSATKPMLEPDMSDDAYITPDIDYSITPISIHSQIDSTPYKPVEMNYWGFRTQSSYYAKLGGGYPLRSVVDIYASKSNPESGYLMGFFNQDGNYSDIKNDYGVMSSATSYHIGTGAAAGLYLGRRILEGLVRYDRDMWSRYATGVSTDKYPLYQNIGFSGFYGDNYSDWSRFNYSMGFNIDQMWSDADYESTMYGANFDMGCGVGNGGVKFAFDYRGVNASESYSNSTIGVGLGYWVGGDVVSFSIGAKYYHDKVVDNSSNYILPRLTLDYNLSPTKLVAYVDVDGELIHNDFASLVERNPYLMSGVSSVENSVDYKLQLGLRGVAASDKLAYNVYVGGGIVLNNIYWAYVDSYYYNGYMINYADQTALNLGADLNYYVTPKVSFDLGYKFSKYVDEDDMLWSNGMPQSELTFGVGYHKGGFSIDLCGEMLSSRSVTEVDQNGTTTGLIEIPTTFDLGIDMEYKTKSGAVVFCELSNLLNQDLYNFARYREYGIGAVVGVKFSF